MHYKSHPFQKEQKQKNLRDVAEDGATEQHRFLGHNDHISMQPARVNRSDVNSINADSAAGDVVKALQQAQHRGFACEHNIQD